VGNCKVLAHPSPLSGFVNKEFNAYVHRRATTARLGEQSRVDLSGVLAMDGLAKGNALAELRPQRR